MSQETAIWLRSVLIGNVVFICCSAIQQEFPELSDLLGSENLVFIVEALLEPRLVLSRRLFWRECVAEIIASRRRDYVRE